ncbi:GMC family oxidoreductase [Roseobacter sp. YSTF-M11]|uniref:GMC family oxidoreductase n=1 Tax=Roseobacter insulae TaxID=2859783 RepID=A0A9X1FWB8_9RHOB|nr:GMC family oxidoreductase [Roseobacter insulae]MBW4708906.1 GMC family oxidoreductase [Roseobacter insulae]
MLVDARTLSEGDIPFADVCIVGAGAAGLSLATQLAAKKRTVVLIESGGLTPSQEADTLNQGTSNHAAYPFTDSRARIFGGTTTKWTGACVPLEPEDFEKRAWLPHSGWPIGADELKDYYPQAAHLFGYSEDLSIGAEVDASPYNQPPFQALPVYYSNPLSFGEMFKRDVEKADNLHAILNATVTEIHLKKDAQCIDKISVMLRPGSVIDVRARHFVLASGGLENARLMLASSRLPGQSALNKSDTVGRFHMEHPMRTVGVLDFSGRPPPSRIFTNPQRTGSTTAQGTFGLSATCREHNRLLNLHIRTYRYHPLEDEPTIIDGKSLVHSRGGRLSPFLDFARKHRMRIGSQAVPYLVWHGMNKTVPAVPIKSLRFTAFLEQEPDRENRLTLSNQKDALGQALPHLHFTESAFLRDSVMRSMSLMAKAFSTAGIGKLRYRAEEIAHLAHYDGYGLHHMGSTRMSDDTRTGVVDRNSTVHGIPNLHIAGSSVFPTGGAANPTLTIVALSLRLGDHLCSLLTRK